MARDTDGFGRPRRLRRPQHKLRPTSRKASDLHFRPPRAGGAMLLRDNKNTSTISAFVNTDSKISSNLLQPCTFWKVSERYLCPQVIR